MATFRLIVVKPAVEQLITYTPDEQREILRLLNIIQLDPSVDLTYKILFPTRLGTETCYVTPEWWIYYFVQGSTVNVTSIERAQEYIHIPH